MLITFTARTFKCALLTDALAVKQSTANARSAVFTVLRLSETTCLHQVKIGTYHIKLVAMR